jgi:hypothetical protein
MAKEAKELLVDCPDCGKDKHHSVIEEHSYMGDSPQHDIQWWGKYQIVECSGCKNLAFRHAYTCTEDIDMRTGGLRETVEVYPDPSPARTPIDRVYRFPKKPRDVYIEVLQAVNNKMLLLATIGLRLLIESICIHQGTSTKNNTLQKAIDGLVSNGLLSKTQADFLHQQRFLGNIAAHEIEALDEEDISTSLEIVETLLKTIYVLPGLSEELEKKNKKRKQKARP